MYLISEQKCPYCHKQLSKEPKKKAVCKDCGQAFRVVTRPSDREKVTATEEEYQAFQFRSNLATFYSKEGEFKKNFGIEKERLKKLKKFGKDPSENDVLWGLANRLLQEKMKSGNWADLGRLYFEMALYLHEIGKPSFRLQQEAKKMELLNDKKTEVIKKVKILTSGCCSACKKQEGKVFLVDEAIKKMPIPVKNCTYMINKKAPEGWCVCGYVPMIE